MEDREMTYFYNELSSGNKHLKVIDWGRIDYSEAFECQRSMAQERISSKEPDSLVLCQHSPVVTIGQSGGPQDLRTSEAGLREEGIAIHQSDRGGQATYHGPGQLVAYPIIHLENKDLHQYVRDLENVLGMVLKSYGLVPEFKDGEPGVWVEGCKIASIGIAVKKWVTYHGIGLNINTDLEAFNLIIPCGHKNEVMTSMGAVLGGPLDFQAVQDEFIRCFQAVFGYTAGHPHWLTLPAPEVTAVDSMEALLNHSRLATVCQSAHCPNLGECFKRGTATFMILGDRCTRSCRFCAVDSQLPVPVDLDEPARVADTVKTLGLKYVVVTSVTRDDLPDGGGQQFANTINAIRSLKTRVAVEVLIPDFKGSEDALQLVCDARPEMFNHNIETVKRLYPTVRPQAIYNRSLRVLKFAADRGLDVKSGLMVGLGESTLEIQETLNDLYEAGCRYLTIGQYLAPSSKHAPVSRYVNPVEFDRWADTARSIGFTEVASGPLVRSSYRADEMFHVNKGDLINPALTD